MNQWNPNEEILQKCIKVLEMGQTADPESQKQIMNV